MLIVLSSSFLTNLIQRAIQIKLQEKLYKTSKANRRVNLQYGGGYVDQ